VVPRRGGAAPVATLTAASSVDDVPARSAAAPPASGVDRYQVVEELGEGSMGKVYRARDLELARDVALKRINPGRWTMATAQDRFRREAQAMAQVEHAGVIRIYDVVIARGELMVAMELARGGTLAAWLAQRPRRWREVVRVFVEAGHGLAAAHHVGLVHRDIKPSNILLDGQCRAKVGDFGLARMFGDDDDEHGHQAIDLVAATFTRTGGVVGTLPYMAPEQLAGREVDARADQFAFCVALWEALCGQRPFRVAAGAKVSPIAFQQAIAAGVIERRGASPGCRAGSWRWCGAASRPIRARAGGRWTSWWPRSSARPAGAPPVRPPRSPRWRSPARSGRAGPRRPAAR
jgi:serine/threonine protein kinase